MKRRNNDPGKNVHQSLKNGVNLSDLSPSRTIQCRECGRSDGLHNFNCLPNHLRFNRFVNSGYRMNLNTWQCLKSLFYFHNESFNVYSHGLAAILFISLAPYVYGKLASSQHDILLYSIHHLTPIVCVLCSAIYHLLMCHENGGETYEKLITLDMLGIWLVTTFGSVAFIKGTYFCFPQLYNMVLLVYSVMAFVSVVYVVKGNNATERIKPLIYLGIIRILVIYSSRGYMTWRGYPTGKISAVWLLIAMELFGFFGGMINIGRIPERWFNGKLDYVCNSHNIMHIIVLICPVFLHLGTVVDFKWMGTAKCLVE